MTNLSKQILIEQLDDRIKRALAIIIQFYPELKSGDLDEIQAAGLVELADSIKFLIGVVYDVNYNDNIDKYKDDILNIARREFDE